MGKRNLKKIIIGAVFIFLSGVSLFMAFFYLEVKPELARRQETNVSPIPRQTSPVKNVVKPQIEKKKSANVSETPNVPKKNAAVLTKKQFPGPSLVANTQDTKTSKTKKKVSLRPLVDEAKGVYSSSEKEKKEGYLWVDNTSSNYVVTLGVVNGIFAGDDLTVYDGNKEIGRVTIDTAFDVISYVAVNVDLIKILKKDYYRVVKE